MIVLEGHGLFSLRQLVLLFVDEQAFVRVRLFGDDVSVFDTRVDQNGVVVLVVEARQVGSGRLSLHIVDKLFDFGARKMVLGLYLVDDPVRHCLLAHLSLVDLLLHCVIGNQPVDKAVLGLAVPEDAADGLGVVTRVPRRVQHNHPVRPDQIDAQTAGPRRQQEQPLAVVSPVKRVDQLFALRATSAAVESTVRPVLLPWLVGEQTLAEEKNFVALLDRFFDEGEGEQQLGAVLQLVGPVLLQNGAGPVGVKGRLGVAVLGTGERVEAGAVCRVGGHGLALLALELLLELGQVKVELALPVLVVFVEDVRMVPNFAADGEGAQRVGLFAGVHGANGLHERQIELFLHRRQLRLDYELVFFWQRANEDVVAAPLHEAL
ncbi:hypothetical protein BpHYR1_018355 [Brachionus plicatilis]|uniref:Uncharacterized protein n=1 Tax=Brachionus plicatilis TaxID=10195 RepID=A0A3M7PBH6_BRAPC|nr:hypothetical protein BpHYR1_018355 [Brachionus plicatilis]